MHGWWPAVGPAGLCREGHWEAPCSAMLREPAKLHFGGSDLDSDEIDPRPGDPALSLISLSLCGIDPFIDSEPGIDPPMDKRASTTVTVSQRFSSDTMIRCIRGA